MLHCNTNLIGFSTEGKHTMSTASMTFGRQPRLTFARSSRWFASAAGVVIGSLRRLDQWLLSPSSQEPQTPEEVMAWAYRIENTDPGLASDLRFAAMRAMDER
jgi:hypothetical protein